MTALYTAGWLALIPVAIIGAIATWQDSRYPRWRRYKKAQRSQTWTRQAVRDRIRQQPEPDKLDQLIAEAMQAEFEHFGIAERVGKHRAPWETALDAQPADVILAVVTDVQKRRRP